MTNDFYFSAALQITPGVLPGKIRAARFWKTSRTPGLAWVLVWPPCRTSKPFVYLVPLSAVELSDQESEPPRMPDWTHRGAYETVGFCMLPHSTGENSPVETANHRLAALCAQHTYAGQQPAWRGQQ